ncbi:unnamed protein product [Phytomonas sp. EM1]|nr:unnamed protein product [Phytomonas sp. EM1]|eukprot:CCW65595.1 unnamed protein product [Phytomonas sp. isolate EM1]
MSEIEPCIEFLGEVDTTMEVVKERFEAYADKPFGIVAESQRMGRGTSGRVWISPKGNLYFTLCIPQDNPKYLSNGLIIVLPLICGIACRKAILALLPGLSPERIGVKWPNDIIYDHKKLGGTLVESSGNYCVIGIGINVEVAPTVMDSGREATSLKCLAENLCIQNTTPPELAKMIWVCLFEILTDSSMTRKKVVEEFSKVMDRSLKLHKRIPGGRDEEELTAVSLNEWGHLRVRHADGVEEELCADYLF